MGCFAESMASNMEFRMCLLMGVGGCGLGEGLCVPVEEGAGSRSFGWSKDGLRAGVGVDIWSRTAALREAWDRAERKTARTSVGGIAGRGRESSGARRRFDGEFGMRMEGADRRRRTGRRGDGRRFGR